MPFQTQYKYLKKEFLDREIADWELDLLCAEKDNLYDYVKYCEKKIMELYLKKNN